MGEITNKIIIIASSWRFILLYYRRVELYLYPPSGPHRACDGIPLFYDSLINSWNIFLFLGSLYQILVFKGYLFDSSYI